MNSESFRPKSRQEVLRELAQDPASLAEYALQLQEQLGQKEQLLAATHQELAQTEQLLATTQQELARRQQELVERDQLLAEARSYIAELKRQLLGPKADKLTPEQEEQLRQLTADVQEQAQRPPPLSQEVLEGVASNKHKQTNTPRRRRQLTPVQLEVQPVVLEPEDKSCTHCHQERPRIGKEVSAEYDYQPAKLVVKETVRYKYGECPCGCGKSDSSSPICA
jgi:hypothetical protein